MNGEVPFVISLYEESTFRHLWLLHKSLHLFTTNYTNFPLDLDKITGPRHPQTIPPLKMSLLDTGQV